MKKVALALLLVLTVGGVSRACSPDCGTIEPVTLVTPFVATVKVQPVVVVPPVVAPVAVQTVVVRQRVVTPAVVRRVVVRHR